MNQVSLLRMAQKLFAESPADIVFVGAECLNERADCATRGVETAAV